jgi:hypothetical protein
MKKLVLASAAALCVLAASQQQASAWSSFKLGVGAQLSWERGGDSSFLWGASKSADLTGWSTYNFQGQPNPNFQGGLAGYDGAPVYQAPQPEKHGQFQAPQPAPAGAAQGAAKGVQPVSYLPVGYYYQTPVNSYYQAPAYVQAPSYWYGN